jgi:hypothetical protein
VRAPLAALLIAVALGALACGGTSHPAEARAVAAKALLQAASGPFIVGQKRFVREVHRHADARDFQAIKADARRFRDVISHFGAQVRRIDFPPERRAEVRAILAGDRRKIAELDAMGASNGFGEFLPLFKRFQRERKTTIDAINNVIHKL